MATVEPATNQPAVPPRSMTANLISVIGLVLTGIYLANPSIGGVIEFIPDPIPGIGNIDEVVATTIFLACLSRLGINILPQGGARKTVVQSHVVKD
jgi:uncharacterized membrane protein YkvA (DUF1232 family)